jgi:hypothetical protein
MLLKRVEFDQYNLLTATWGTHFSHVTVAVLMALILKCTTFWNITPCCPGRSLLPSLWTKYKAMSILQYSLPNHWHNSAKLQGFISQPLFE